MTIEKSGRHWRVLDPHGQLVCLAVYRKGAEEVVRRLNGQYQNGHKHIDGVLNDLPKLKLVIDCLQQFKGYWGCRSKCRLRVYRGDGGDAVVIATELPANPGTSVTNAAESLALDTWLRLGRPSPFTWIEHYPQRGKRRNLAETFDRVDFVLTQRGFERPTWTRMTRDQVEQLVGQPVEVQSP